VHATSAEGAAGRRGGQEGSKVTRASGPAGKKAPAVVRLAKVQQITCQAPMYRGGAWQGAPGRRKGCRVTG